MAPLIRDRHRLERSTPVGFTRLAHVQAPISGKPRDRCLQRNTIGRLKGVDARLRGLWTGVNALEVPRCARDTRNNQPTGVEIERRRRSIVSGLLFTMNGATKAREPSARRAAQPAAAPLAGRSATTGAGDSKRMSARLMVACRVAAVIFAPNRSVT